MALAATANNLIHAQQLLAAAASTPATRGDHELPEQVWETEGGHLPPLTSIRTRMAKIETTR